MYFKYDTPQVFRTSKIYYTVIRMLKIILKMYIACSVRGR